MTATDRDPLPQSGHAAAGVGAAALGRLTHPGVRVAVLVGLVLAVSLVGLRSDGIDVDTVRAVIDDLGLLGPAVFVVLFALAATLLLPAAPFALAAGLLFGPVLGSATALVGATAGATGAFLLGRALGREAVARLGGRRLAALDDHLATRGFLSLLVLRLVPLLPFNLLSVGSGVTGLRLRDYVLATAVGIVPGTVAYAAVGGTITDPASAAFLGSIVVLVLVSVIAGFGARRMRGPADPTPR